MRKWSRVGIEARAGQGKSRLIYEFTHSDRCKNCNILIGGAFSHTSNIPLFSITNLFSHFMNIKAGENLDKIKEKLQPYIASIEISHAVNAALALLDISDSDPAWNTLPPAIQRNFKFEVGVQILSHLALKDPLIFIIEDLHWIHSETENFLNLLISGIEKTKILFLGTYRLEYKDPWINKPNYTVIPLNPLLAESEMVILNSFLGTDPSLDVIKTKLSATCSGNPFFLSEIIQSLISDKIITGYIKDYHFNPKISINSVYLPETIFAVIQTQIDRLSFRQKKVLQIASVIGEKFAYNLLSELIEIDQKELRKEINELINQQYIFEIKIYRSLNFLFDMPLSKKLFIMEC